MCVQLCFRIIPLPPTRPSRALCNIHHFGVRKVHEGKVKQTKASLNSQWYSCWVQKATCQVWPWLGYMWSSIQVEISRTQRKLCSTPCPFQSRIWIAPNCTFTKNADGMWFRKQSCLRNQRKYGAMARTAARDVDNWAYRKLDRPNELNEPITRCASYKKCSNYTTRATSLR